MALAVSYPEDRASWYSSLSPGSYNRSALSSAMSPGSWRGNMEVPRLRTQCHLFSAFWPVVSPYCSLQEAASLAHAKSSSIYSHKYLEGRLISDPLSKTSVHPPEGLGPLKQLVWGQIYISFGIIISVCKSLTWKLKLPLVYLINIISLSERLHHPSCPAAASH